MRVASRSLSPVFSTRVFHGALLCVGVLFLLSDAFHGNVWFDESYSIAIANHSFADIWRIGASDVHPVLFYEALHVLSLVFGQNVLVFRLFAVLGLALFALLGLTHVRPDFGWKAGVLFTFLSLFMPYMPMVAVEIRMYSWAIYAVMLCALYAYRIFSAVRGRAADVRGKETGTGVPREEPVGGTHIPIHWWVLFFASALASAYLHYFAAIAAFVINVFLFAYLLVRRKGIGRPLLIHGIGAVTLVLLYVPWLFALKSQISVVSNTYWADFVFPTSLIELGTYPVVTSKISFASRGFYGDGIKMLVDVLLPLFLLSIGFIAAYLIVRGFRAAFAGNASSVRSRFLTELSADRSLACLLGFAVYGGVFGIAWLVSDIMGSYVLYYRYLVVAVGPLFLSLALILSRVESRFLLGSFCVVLLSISCVNQVLLVSDDYDPANREPLVYFENLIVSAQAENPDTTEGGVLVLSSDIGIEGVTAVMYPEVFQTYLDWQPGNWGDAYEAYAPTLSTVKSWNQALEDYRGRFIVLGQSNDGSLPRDIADITAKPGIESIETQTFYRPYERSYFTIALLERV